MWRCLGLHDQLRADIAVKNAKGFFLLFKSRSLGGQSFDSCFFVCPEYNSCWLVLGENFQVIANLAFLFPAAGMIGLSFLLTPELQVL